MCVCERVFSVGFCPELDSMSPARSRRSASHAVGTRGWLPPKNWVAGPPEKRGRWIQFAQSPPPTVLWHTNHEQVYPFGAFLLSHTCYLLVCAINNMVESNVFNS